MTRVSSNRHRFPAIVIQHTVWLYFYFTLSLRDVEAIIGQICWPCRTRITLERVEYLRDQLDRFPSIE